MNPDDLATIRARLAALPAHITVEPHGDGEAIYSERDPRMWPAVRTFLEHGPADVAALLAEVERLPALLAEIERLTKELDEALAENGSLLWACNTPQGW